MRRKCLWVVRSEYLQIVFSSLIYDSNLQQTLNTHTLGTMELVLTAMRTAAGYGAEMRFDMNPFVESLRKSLRWIHLPRHCEGPESCVETAMYSVSSAFLKRREADKRRVTLCAIELLSGSLQMHPNVCLATLATCRDLIQRYASTLKTSLLAPPEMAREELGVLTHANDALIACLEIVVDVLSMRSGDHLRHQHCHILAQDFLGGVSEHALGRFVVEPDTAVS